MSLVDSAALESALDGVATDLLDVQQEVRDEDFESRVATLEGLAVSHAHLLQKVHDGLQLLQSVISGERYVDGDDVDARSALLTNLECVAMRANIT